jgi:hypothetical protein
MEKKKERKKEKEKTTRSKLFCIISDEDTLKTSTSPLPVLMIMREHLIYRGRSPPH